MGSFFTLILSERDEEKVIFFSIRLQQKNLGINNLCILKWQKQKHKKA